VRILVVDDDRAVRESLRRSLAFNGYTVDLAEDGVEALEAIASERPDALVLDVMMPVLDGFAVCRKLRKDPQLKHTPVILLTAVGEHIHDTDYPADGVLQADADEYIEKPVDPKLLLATVGRLLS